MMFVKRFTSFFAVAILVLQATAQKEIKTDVLVVGGGTGGTAAGIQSARQFLNTLF